MRKGLLAAKLLFVALLAVVFLGGCSSDPNSIWYLPPPIRASERNEINEHWEGVRRDLELQDQKRRLQEMEWEIQQLKDKGTLFER
jgi:uncharacterized lipoprotein YajG